MSSGQETIRILIVDDIAETRESLKKMLYFEPDMEVVGTARNGQEAIELAGKYQPHVVLMDINMPGLDGISASRKITDQVPYAQIVMMSVQSETDYMRRSMAAGARDFLTKPFTMDEMISTVRRVYDMSAHLRAADAGRSRPASRKQRAPQPTGKRQADRRLQPQGRRGVHDAGHQCGHRHDPDRQVAQQSPLWTAKSSLATSRSRSTCAPAAASSTWWTTLTSWIWT